MEFTQFTDINLDIQVYPTFMDEEESLNLFNFIYSNAKFKHSHYTKKGVLSKKRNKALYGNIPYYIATFRGKKIFEKINNWDDCLVIKNIANKLTLITNQEYHVCVIQLYNNGEVGINPHRDKEMKHGTIITSISLGENRIMHFESGMKHIDVLLNNGSLCLINPPTNDSWLHSIVRDKSNKPRISMIFRNCENMS
jgi:alkylated DNA repair dioxygenase AlkB